MFPYIDEKHVYVNMDNRHRDAATHRKHKPAWMYKPRFRHWFCHNCGDLLVHIGQRLLTAAQPQQIEAKRLIIGNNFLE